MSFSAPRFSSIAETYRIEVENLLFNVGILCRVFGRGKSDRSLKKKLEKDAGKYHIGGKLIQDSIGLRIAVYFPEDVSIVKELLCAHFEHDAQSSTIDLPSDSTFSVVRYNLIFRVSQEDRAQFMRLAGSYPIDPTFEVQIRTILSEGWHEVEHDLRYKCKDHWVKQQDLSRTLNGVMATLETAEWSMTRVFDELAYRHYKSANWAAMLHTTLKMRLPPSLSPKIEEILTASPDVAKKLSRIDRKKVMRALFALETKIPVSIDNVVYLWNFVSLRDSRLTHLTEDFLQELFHRSSDRFNKFAYEG
jgi:ppGpp synthetase/RelA/SpoT-type nucleotidyltranferase